MSDVSRAAAELAGLVKILRADALAFAGEFSRSFIGGLRCGRRLRLAAFARFELGDLGFQRIDGFLDRGLLLLVLRLLQVCLLFGKLGLGVAS